MQQYDGYKEDTSTTTTKQALVSQSQTPKALRFVTNYGAPHPKRRRIGAACLTCRKRKTACSGERPSCETCSQNKLDCAGYPEAAAAAAAGQKRTATDTTATKAEDKTGIQKRGPARVTFSSQEDHMTSRLGKSRSTPSPPNNVNGHASPPVASDALQNEQPQNSLFSGSRNRMPYFRWLGPTAIMPGFKQMVVKIKRQDTDMTQSSTDGGPVRSPPLTQRPSLDHGVASIYSAAPAALESEARTPLNLPFYDTSPMPPSELITHLANTFFTHLGCNYPFLQRQRFLRDLEEKQVDTILVDAVCALAARFSTHPLLAQQFPTTGENKASPAEYGHAFAQRAKTALTDTFPCPSVAAAQAALLLAYNEFGEQRDSGLWMYLGIAIRLTQDLGLHKIEGLRYVGKDGPTPKMVKSEARNGVGASPSAFTSGTANKDDRVSLGTNDSQASKDSKEIEEQRAVEQERVDTFWAIFFLDRVVSSGTGRRSTLRDNDIELSFPSPSEMITNSDWPAPFPALIRIVHLYGRVADQLNKIKGISDTTAVTSQRLAAMEHQVTTFYQGLSPRLHFDAMNFQYYMKAGEGTNFVLLHFWFHTLIVLLHQPTLLKTFEGGMLQLFPNSQQLSMSSAKTIADILSYSQLMDAKASLGNPFTSQPIYIAACAFLRETAERTASSTAQSRANSPLRGKENGNANDLCSTSAGAAHSVRRASLSTIVWGSPRPGTKATAEGSDSKVQLAKHSLLATAASQHYQLCYKALQSLETYWAGAKYILTVLDQKFQGVGDPLLYTAEERESSMEQPKPVPAFTSPGWRRKFSWDACIGGANIGSLRSSFWPPKGLGHAQGGSSGVNHSKAIGWTLTGTMDSPSTNLAWHYASGRGTDDSNIDPQLSVMPNAGHQNGTRQAYGDQYDERNRTGAVPRPQRHTQDKSGRQAMPPYTGGNIMVPDGESVLMSFSTPFDQSGNVQSSMNGTTSALQQVGAGHPQINNSSALTSGDAATSINGSMSHFPHMSTFMGGSIDNVHANFIPGDMMIETQDVDMSMLGLDMMPWFNPSYSPHDMMNMYVSHGEHPIGASQGADEYDREQQR